MKTESKSYVKLSDQQIEEILKIKNPSRRKVAEIYGVHYATISRLLSGKTRIRSFFSKRANLS